MDIWKKLSLKAKEKSRAFTVLAPMEDVTDSVFRQIVIKAGRPDLFFTEFTSTDGLCSKGYSRVVHRLKYTAEEKPLVAQIWGKHPEKFTEAIPLLKEMGFDGIDINMGCPQKKVVHSGGGGGLIRTKEVALQIIRNTKSALEENNMLIPLSVKTRIGFNEYEPRWISLLLEQQLAALTVHVRTVAEMSKVPARWELLREIVLMRNAISPETVIIANGDITEQKQFEEFYKDYGVDGVMIGRGIFNNLWIFSGRNGEGVPKKEKLHLLKEHITLFIETWGNNKNRELLKKFFKVYCKEFQGATELRQEIIQMNDLDQILERIEEEF